MKAVFTGKNTKYKPIDSLPFPDYEPFGIQDMIDEYSHATRLTYRYCRSDARPYNIVASRSCPFSCTFCIHGHDRPPYRARSIESVMEEIKVSYERYQFNILIILDELFVANKKRMVAFCEGIIEGKERYGWDFNWMFQTHANARFNLESLKLAKRAGCFLFSYGLESASQPVLNSMNKKTKVSQIVEAIKMAEEAGVGFSGNLIFGDVAETEETIAESLSFWLEHCRRVFVFLSKVNPFPGSKLFDVCVERGLFADKREYYEHINDFKVNMTNIPIERYAALMGLIGHMETEWLFVKTVLNTRYEIESPDVESLDGESYMGGKKYKVTSECPYCGEESVYREIVNGFPFSLGTGCTKCNKKIKVEVR